MKILNKIMATITLVVVLTMTGCLKDSDYSNNKYGTKNTQDQNLVEIHLTSSDNTNFVARAYPLIGRDTTITQFIPVHLTSGTASGDITVTYELLDTLNSAIVDSLVNIEEYVLAGPDNFTILNQNSKVTIPAGSNTGYISVKLNPNDLIGDTYVTGIRITNVSDPKYTISNLTDGIVKFGPANEFDGVYKVEGTMVDMVSPALTGWYPTKADLVTMDLISVAYKDKDLGSTYGHLITSGGSASYYGSFAPVFSFNPDYTVKAVVNKYGQPSGNGRSAELDPSGVNKYDPITRVLKVKYWMNQPGASHRTSFDETMTYLGPR